MLLGNGIFYDTWGAWVKVPSREEFESLKSSVSDGKSAIAAAITGKGVAASGSDTFLQLSNSIAKIRSGFSYNNMSYYKSQKGTVQGTDGFSLLIISLHFRQELKGLLTLLNKKEFYRFSLSFF